MAKYGTPFKMKGSPMQRNFGIGGSPAKQTIEEIKDFGKKVYTKGKELYGEIKKGTPTTPKPGPGIFPDPSKTKKRKETTDLIKEGIDIYKKVKSKIKDSKKTYGPRVYDVDVKED